MHKLIYAANISLDGFLEDETGSFDWSVDMSNEDSQLRLVIGRHNMACSPSLRVVGTTSGYSG